METDWGTATFAGLVVGSLSLALCGAVMLDLVKNSATSARPNPVSGVMLQMLGPMYK
jgi:hypothetical protein